MAHDFGYHVVFLIAMVALGIARVRFWRRQSEVLGVAFLRREATLKEVRQIAALVAFAAIVLHMVTPRLMTWSQFPVPEAIRLVAAVLTVLLVLVVMAIARYARLRLEPPARRTFIATGPYRFVRHPLYASMIALALPMTLLAASWVVGLVGLAFAASLIIRARREDAALMESGGADYREYAERTPAFIPRHLRPESPNGA